MFLLIEILIMCIHHETQETLHEFTRYVTISDKGTVIRGQIYRPYDADDRSLEFAARLTINSELHARDAKALDNPIRSIREKLQGVPWCLDSAVVERTAFESEEAYELYVSDKPEIFHYSL